MHRRPASPTVTLAASGPGSRPPTPVGQRRRGSMDSATLLEANDSFHLHQREASALLEQLRSAIAGESLFARRASDATSQPERKKSVSPTISGRNGSQPVSVPVQLSAPSKQAPVLPSLSQPSLAFPHPSPPSQPQSIHRGGTPPYPYPAPAPPVHASTVNRRIAKPHHVMSVPSPDVPSLRSDTPASHPYDSESPSVYATASVANRVKALPGVLSASQTCSLLTARLHQRSSPNPGRAFIAFSGPIAVPRPPVAAPAPAVSRPSPPVFSVDSHRVLFTSVSPSSSSSTQSLSYAAIHRSQGSTPSRVSTQTQTDAPTVSTGTQSESTGVTERNGRSGRRVRRVVLDDIVPVLVM